MAQSVSARSTHRRRAMSEINMVPLIDIMLVLLVIFMVTATLLQPSVVDLPKLGKASTAKVFPIQLIIRKSGKLELRDGLHHEDVTYETLGPTLQPMLVQATANTSSSVSATQPTQRPVVISADRTVQYDQVIAAMDHLQRLGIERIGLSVEQRS